ncbi:hypothetical protein [Sulfurimonas sp.]|uniref:hypothetical protein n=1 Tax=Sulfurimonas sp. TaxID=2022749 RepID=UPI003D0BDA87
MRAYLLLFLLINSLMFTGCNPSTSSSGDSESSSHDYDSDHDDDSNDNSSNTSSSTTSGDTTTTNLRYSTHNQGIACGNCHTNGEESFASGGTIFYTLNAANKDGSHAAANYKIKLLLNNGQTITYSTARGTGNVYKGWINAGVDKYTAAVIDSNGNVVNKSLEYSHDATRFNCNSCHTQSGISSAPGRIVSYDYYASLASTTTTTTTTTDTNSTTSTTTTGTFTTDVLPILQAKCAGCHGNSGNFSITNSSTPYAGVLPFVDTTNATASSLLQKASGTVGHAGGTVLATTSADYITIRDWIDAGALDTSNSTSTSSSTTTTTPTTTTTSTQISFASDVLPLLQSSCSGCHGSSGNFSITRSSTPYAGVTPFVNTSSATASSLLQKASAQVSHGGGRVYSTTSTQYTTIRDWISQGALNN